MKGNMSCLSPECFLFLKGVLDAKCWLTKRDITNIKPVIYLELWLAFENIFNSSNSSCSQTTNNLQNTGISHCSHVTIETFTDTKQDILEYPKINIPHPLIWFSLRSF